MIWILLFLSTMKDSTPPDANRILVAQQAQAMEVRAQHREIERVQPQSHLTPEEVAANHKAELDRLVGKEGRIK